MAYPCGDCGKNCVKSCIACDRCDRWFHIACQKLSKAQFKSLSSTSCDYLCTFCTYKNGVYDYDLALSRLEKYSEMGNLKEGVLIEKLLLRQENMESMSNRADLTFTVKKYIINLLTLFEVKI